MGHTKARRCGAFELQASVLLACCSSSIPGAHNTKGHTLVLHCRLQACCTMVQACAATMVQHLTARLIRVAVLGLLALCIGRLVPALAAFSVPVDVTHLTAVRRAARSGKFSQIASLVWTHIQQLLHPHHTGEATRAGTQEVGVFTAAKTTALSDRQSLSGSAHTFLVGPAGVANRSNCPQVSTVV